MGATYEDVLAIYPEIANDAFFQGHLEADGGGLTTVRSVSLFDEANSKRFKVGLFFKDRILVVISNKSVRKKHVTIGEAISEFSKPLGVADDQWTVFYDAAAELKCADFSFYLNSDEQTRGISMSVHRTPNETR